MVALATEMAHDFRFEALVPHEPVPIFPATTLNLNAGKTPEAVIFTGFSVLRSQPDWLFDVVRHSTTYTWSRGLKPVPETRTLEWFLRPATGDTWNLRGPTFTGIVVVVVVVVAVGNAKVIGVLAASAVGGLVLTLMLQFDRSLDVVPHVVVPTVPVATVSAVVNVPVALVVATLAVLTSQPNSDVAPTMHSRAYTVSLPMKPVPVTLTDWPFTNAVKGVATIVGVAADALATPREARPPRTSAPTAILVIIRLIVYVLSIAVVTNSLNANPWCFSYFDMRRAMCRTLNRRLILRFTPTSS